MMTIKFNAISLAVPLLLSHLLAGCSDGHNHESNATSGSKDPLPVNVQIEVLRPAAFQEVITVAGVVKAFEDVMISPQEGGVVKSWKVDKGQEIRAGQLLVALNDEVLQASYDAANADYKLAELNYEKQKQIYADTLISEMQYQSAMLHRDAAKAQADLMKARLEYMWIRSPIAGVLDDRYYDAGEFAPPAAPLAHVVNLSKIKILLEIPEIHAGRVALGAMTTVTIDAVPGDTLSGKIAFIGRVISSSNRTLPVEIHLPNPAARLKPEMIAKARLVMATHQDALLIDETLAQRIDRDRYVVYVENNGRAQERQIIMGARHNGRVEIRNGLQDGDRVIVSGTDKLAEGMPVNVVNGT